MKKGFLFLGLISVILAIPARGQIVSKYKQGFELNGETYGYTVVQGTATPVTTLQSSGSRALKLQHGATDVVIELDTIDFTDNGSYQNFILEFMHICDINSLTTQSSSSVAVVEAKRTVDNTWTQLNGNENYDYTWGGGSDNFVQLGSFSDHSYTTWRAGTPTNKWWRRERFKLTNILMNSDQGSDLSYRKIQIRFRLKARVIQGATSQGWYLDNIKLECSPNSMVLPVVTMYDYPDVMDYANSSGAHLKASFSTVLTAGMNTDSIYVLYQLGNLDSVQRKPMTAISGQTGMYEAYIPFCGYDTIVKWRVVGRDNTVNHNKANFPHDESGWEEYRCIRGKAYYSPMTLMQGPGTSLVPFPGYGNAKCQIVYDSAEMSNFFGPGGISQLRYPVAATVPNSVRNQFVIKMCNLDGDYTFNSDNFFYPDFMKTVYDSSLTIIQNANTNGIIDLQDTFYYAGKGLMIMTYCKTSSDPSAVSVRTYNAQSNSSTTGSLQRAYSYADPFDPFTSPYFTSGTKETVRPNFTMRINANRPLDYDCGISGFIHPNDTTPATAYEPNNVVVTLKNYGSKVLNAVRIYYSVDGGASQYYDWSGTLAGGATTQVTISTTQTYVPGYHEMLAWVEDSVTSNGSLYRDHEPLNDTLWTKFITCDGPMRGVRMVGGSTPDYQSLEKLLYALSQCGVDSVLTVKLAPGYYTPHMFPVIPGTSAQNYVQFEPASGSVTFLSATTDTAQVSWLVNLQNANHIRFKNINFLSNAMSNPTTYHVRMGTTSVGCQFEGCTFNDVQGGTLPENYMSSSALLYSGGADSLVVKNCTFIRGTVGLSLVGPAQDNMAHGSRAYGNSFSHQGTNGIVVRNQVNAEVDSNVFDNVYANSSYVILLQDCEGATKVTRNTVYVTSGASCIGVTNFYGTQSDYAIIANNMLVSDDEGTSNMLTTPLNIITANWTKVIFNAIKMNAPERNGIAATTFGGGVLENSQFYNNIVACMDTSNYAFSYIPTEDATNYIGYNIYYSKSALLNKYDGINCYNMNNWTTHCPMDGNSQNANPAFLGSTLTDLRSYSQNVKGHGVPFAEVDEDIYGTERDSVAPCIGAFEFSSLPYDFEITEFLEPYEEYCDAPTAAPLRFVLKNTGVNTYDPDSVSTTVQLAYSRGTAAGIMTPGLSGNMVINRIIPAEDTIILNTNATLPFPTNGLKDTTYRLYVWLTSTIDPNPANDTNMIQVTAHYHAPAPDSINVTSDYGTAATVTATGGLQTWYGNIYTAGTSKQSDVYWYTTATSTEPVWRGNTITTEPLYLDTTLYIRQKRDYPIVRMTEVMIKQSNPGVTYPMPLWMNASTAFAVELTNIGDYPANLEGDTLWAVSNLTQYNNKIFTFPNVTIEPGHSLVVQYRSGINNVDSSLTIAYANNFQPPITTNLGLIYISKGEILDALALNDITTQTQWTQRGVPNTVWTGPGIVLLDSVPTAGVIRTAWPANPNNLTYSNVMWTQATDTNRMTLGTVNTNLLRYSDNGCLGDVAPVHIHLINLPDVDIVVEDIDMEGGCGMGQMPVKALMRNYGAYASGELVLHYKVQGHPQYAGQALTLQEGCDTLTNGIGPSTTITYTFDSIPDFTVASASVDFDITVWVEKLDADNTSFNDTATLSLTSLFTPSYPNVYPYDTVQYANTVTLQSMTAPLDSLAWYDRYMNPLDTCNVFTTDYLYGPDTFYVSAFGAKMNAVHIGALASLNSATSYPSPYNPNKTYVKEQYLYKASDLEAAGHGAGAIQTVSFYLDQIMGTVTEMTFTDYVISIGTTSQTSFTSNNNWQEVSVHYTADTLTLTTDDYGWVTHNLDMPFQWNGVDNIVVQITRTASPAITTGARTRYTNGGSNTVLYKNDNTSSVVDYTGNGTRQSSRPDIQFGFVDYGCEGPKMPVYIAIVGTPDAEAALEWPVTDSTVTFTSCDSSDLNVVLRNMGEVAFANDYTIDYWIDDLHGVYTGTHALAAHSDTTVTVTKHLLTPGRHTLRMAVTLPNDTVQTNDTIERIINVRFCAGTYTIGTTGLYADFTTAIDTLNHAGIDGAVIFTVEDGLYNEQIVLGAIEGSSVDNTITFRGDVTDPTNVEVRYAPTQADNYVMMVSGSQFVNFEGITFVSRGSGNYNNVIVVENATQVHFTNDVIRVKANLYNANASGMIIGENVHALYVENSELDSGYYAIRSLVYFPGLSDGVYITNNVFRAALTSIYLRKVDDVYISANQISSHATAGGRALTGIFLAEHNGPATIERNNIVLSDTYSANKQGIKLINVTAANATRSMVSNNMCAIVSTGGTDCSGIRIDSSQYVNVYYNTCQVKINTTGTAGNNTKTLYVGTTSMGVYIMNNLLSNLSGGSAMYVQSAANVGNSNYNNYYVYRSNRIVTWNTTQDCESLAQLIAADGMDANSLNLKPYYVSDTDMHLTVGWFCEKAQYSPEVPLDLDGVIRPQIPNPCMGAHEFVRKAHNIAITDVTKPMIQQAGILEFTDNIEGDTLWVVASFTNDGTSTESNLKWWAEIKGVTPALQSTQRTIVEMLPQDNVVDSNYIVMPLGVYDTQTVVVHIPLANDSLPENNVYETQCYLDPAYNLWAQEAIIVDNSNGCRLQNTAVKVKLTNTGRKTFYTGTSVPVGFHAKLQTSGITVSTLPTQWVETLTLPMDVEPAASVTLDLNQTVNLYPTGNDCDITVRCRAWASYEWDHRPANDTSSFVSHTSKYTPHSPVGVDLHIPYATWDTIFASQTDNPPSGNQIHRPIRWHTDSTMLPYYAPNGYPASTWWETPQYFDDTVYFLSCVSASGCTSYYSPVHVYINPRVPVDMAVLNVADPADSSQRVYMTTDSIKLNIINYGTQPQTNFPVVFELVAPNGQILQHVQQVCTATVQPDQVYTFCFDSLVHIPTWSTTQYYSINAWTDLPNENVRLNDTMRIHSVFMAVPDDVYPDVDISSKPGLDITHVAFSSLDNQVSPSGNSYINFVNASFLQDIINNPATIADSIIIPDFGGTTNQQQLFELRALHMVKGTSDTLVIMVENSDKPDDYATTGWISVWIDMDRDGQFNYDSTVVPVGDTTITYYHSEIFFQDTIISRVPKKAFLTLPDSIRTGYMRMRVIVEQGASKRPKPECGFQFGCAHDYLLYIENKPREDIDVSAARIVAPRDQHIGGHTGAHAGDSVTVSFQVANKGALTVNGITVNYTFSNPNSAVDEGSFQWGEVLDPGQSAIIELPARIFDYGVTDLVIAISTMGDTNTVNDTLLYQYFRPTIKTLVWKDDFEGVSEWFIPRGYSPYTRNLWERATSHKPNIMACISDSTVLTTNANGFVNVASTGNVSYAYTPIYDISTIRPDTIDIWVARDMATGHAARLEYCNYKEVWKAVGSSNDTMWFTHGSVWDSVSSGYGYEHCRFPLTKINGDFQQSLQFRMAYMVESGSTACDGIAVDDFVVGRARRPLDVGVVDITYPTEPKFGQTIHPRVILRNWGLDTIDSINVAYLPYGVNLARVGTYRNPYGLAPGAEDIFEFPSTFTVMNDFPDTFQICAYTTVNMDLYKDNDTVCRNFYLSPLDNDMGTVEILNPIEHVVAGDSIVVTARIRNYGQAPVSGCNVTYVFNETYTVTNYVDFNEMLGRDLESFEYFNYSFPQKFRASMGYMHLSVYVTMDNDDYLFNDTVTMSLEGLSAITDLSARAAVLNLANQEFTKIQVIVDNVGARAANNFHIGCWYYNDPTTLIDTVYHASSPLPALSTLVFEFDNKLPRHDEYYKNITAYVYAADDNDRSNDTTTVIIDDPQVDLHPVRILIEENRTDSCRVRLEVENIGTLLSRDDQNMHAYVTINGKSLPRNTFKRAMMPGNTYVFEMKQKVPKNGQRNYQGSARITFPADADSLNNQTTRVEVLNYFEGVPFVTEADGMVLHQNYPNPFSNTTRIDFYLPSAGDVRFFVMDELGRLVYQDERHYGSGQQSVHFGDGKLAAGVYYYGIEKDGQRLMRRMVMQR
ncbi:MAG: hypothetical protein IJM88_03650 [Bacteroidales bacterium]|nr:hypothetical protein [Bacteroidales bacterium]